ncbi:MAG: glycyl-radical enzyme activating protein [Clostridiales bacterium]|nr:glycyl-radical enzyme activating protein [Clostridiales bacterium]
MGVVFNIQRCSLQDGPGIRTTVFLKGCPLRCKWCHNPESWHRKPELSFFKHKCGACGVCVKACPRSARSISDGVCAIDRALCTVCGECVKKCFNDALTIIGEEKTAEQVIAEVKRDMPFYERSGGGLTLSGGEPFAQPEFLCSLLAAGKQAGLHICVETCGYVDEQLLRDSMPYVDIYLYDYKATGAENHKAFTGVTNERILSNLYMLLENRASVILRCPMIQGENDTVQHLAAIAELYKTYPHMLGVEIMAYHNMGRDKGVRVGIDAGEMTDMPLTPESTKAEWIKTLRDFGCNIAKIG